MSFEKKKNGYNQRCKYVKIPIKTKVKFLRKVIIDGLSIKDSSSLFNINYSTAKTLIRQYKANHFEYDLELPSQEPTSIPEAKSWVRCGYKSIGEDSSGRSIVPTMDKPSFYLVRKDLNQEEGSLQVKGQKAYVQTLYQKFQIISSISYY